MGDIKITSSDVLPIRNRVEPKDKELKKACKDFESVFTYKLLQGMRRTVEKCDLFHGGQGEDIYESLLDQELAKDLSGTGHNSLAGMLYHQFRRRGPSPETTWPLKAPVSSEFGWRRDPVNGQKYFHYGVDLAAGDGDEVRAFLPGKVRMSGYRQGYGNTVVLDHGDGFTTLYAHNKHNLVKPGDRVSAGTPIARAGSSGRSTGPHLHFEIRYNTVLQNPRAYLP